MQEKTLPCVTCDSPHN